MTPTPTATITRAQLQAATETALADAPTLYSAEPVPIPASVAEAVRDVAATAERITTAWWDEMRECGCLIGTIYGKDTPTLMEDVISVDERYAEYLVGVSFPNALRRTLKVGWFEMSTTFDVIDS